MNVIDILIILIFIFFCIKGFIKGFVHELFSLLIIVLGLIISFLFYRPLGSIVFDYMKNRELSLILSFLSIFLLITVILLVLRNRVLDLVDDLNLSDIDRFLGLFIGMGKGFLLSSTFLVFLTNHPVMDIDSVISNSLFYPIIERVFFSFLSLLPEHVSGKVMRVLGIR
jgi:membrane protein required for colicin V production